MAAENVLFWRQPTEYTDDRFDSPERPNRSSDVLDDEPYSPEFFGVEDDDELSVIEDDHAIDEDTD